MKNFQNPKPVQKVEVSEKNVKLRVILLIVAIVVAVAAFVFAVNGLFSSDPGWTEITVPSISDWNSGNEFTFTYNLGAGGMSATREKKALTEEYTEASIHAYQTLAAEYDSEKQGNLYDLNHHPNTMMEVDPLLYSALKAMDEHSSRVHFLAPVYRVYDNVFYSLSDENAAQWDPHLSEDALSRVTEILSYATDPESVKIEFFGENKVRLVVSQFYRAYAYENGIEDFVDFYYLRNAFIADYLAETMQEKGYTNGAIFSVDGYTRILSGAGDFDTRFYDNVNGYPVLSAIFPLKAGAASVNLHDFKIHAKETLFYRYQTGEVRSPLISEQTGLNVSALNALLGYSSQMDCAEIALTMLPNYLAEEFDFSVLSQWQKKGIECVTVQEKTVFFTEETLPISVNEAIDPPYQKQVFLDAQK